MSLRSIVFLAVAVAAGYWMGKNGLLARFMPSAG